MLTEYLQGFARTAATVAGQALPGLCVFGEGVRVLGLGFFGWGNYGQCLGFCG